LSGLTYEQLVRELFPRLSGGIRWGLDRVEAILEEAGHPERRYASVHVGGTNGKGSTSAAIAAALRAGGHRTGLYTSPHLCSFRERIQLNGQPLSDAELLEAAESLWPSFRRTQPSFFEATTSLAFLALANAGVDVAVIEVGLGGRLDATNVVTPVLSVLTNVAMDHAEYLGNTLELVAAEKAGIIKAGVPVITAEPAPAIRSIFAARAAALSAPFHALADDDVSGVRVGASGTRFRVRTREWGEMSLYTPLIGEHQAMNAALGVRALELLPDKLRPEREQVAHGVASVQWPGRLQIEQRSDGVWMFDVAHNTAGVEAVAATVRKLDLARPLVLLVGILGDKDWRAMLPPLFDIADAAVLTIPPTAPEARRWDPAAVLQEVGRDGDVIPDFDVALRHARTLAQGGTVLVTGSFHTVGDALATLGLAPFGVDPHEVPAGAAGGAAKLAFE
jgi:dihydrofolate synthase/folylpolyglutamate synthase